MKKFNLDWMPTILGIGIFLVYAYVMIFSIYDPAPDDELVLGRVHDLMIWVVGYFMGSAYKKHKKKDKE